MYEDGRLHVRPVEAKHRMPAGQHSITLRSGGSGLLLIPADAPEGPLPFALLLHGAGARARDALQLLSPAADRVALLAPQARSQTWDLVGGGFGPDVELIDDLLAVAFARVQVDPARLAIGGFSDGASYALSLGVVNGDLFSHVLAFSPGFVAPGRHGNSPRVFISHGKQDAVLPVQRCSGQIAPALRSAGHEVRYCEFDGGHELPAHIRAQAMTWFTQGARVSSARPMQPVN